MNKVTMEIIKKKEIFELNHKSHNQATTIFLSHFLNDTLSKQAATGYLSCIYY